MLVTRSWLQQEMPEQAQELHPERVLQIGEGNFLRGFVDWLIHQLNKNGKFKGSVVVATPLALGAAKIQEINDQDGLYTVWLRGMENGKVRDDREIIQSISRAIDPYQQWDQFLQCARNPQIDIVVSNTTEAGLTYLEEGYDHERCNASFPAKLTAYLYERFQAFAGDAQMGLDIVPCELVENNGDILRELVLRHASNWNLSSEFVAWVQESNRFYNTLVDSIVTGFQTSTLDPATHDMTYEDKLGIIREPFHLWVIQGDARLKDKWDFGSLGLNVRYEPDVAPFRLIKVRILNGAHTSLAGLATLSAIETVRETVTHPVLGSFVQHLLHDEVNKALQVQHVELTEAESFAAAVMERFSNPLLRHEIASLQLNALSKVKVRLLPTFMDYIERFATLPKLLTMAIAGQLLYFHLDEDGTSPYAIRDDATSMQLVQQAWALEKQEGLEASVKALLSLEEVWGQDLNTLPSFSEHLVYDIEQIRELGVLKAVENILNH